jgi:predicted acylesterase/phospholipase RssA
MQYSFAYQGGGAKFVSLLAAADAIHSFRDSIDIEHVSGTSAGALVAGLIALGVEPPRLKNLLIEQGRDIISTVVPLRDAEKKSFSFSSSGFGRTIHSVRIAGKILTGRSIYSFDAMVDAYKLILNELGYRSDIRIHEVACFHPTDSTNLTLVATDLRTGKPIYFESLKPGKRSMVLENQSESDSARYSEYLLAEAVAHSASIPFLFKARRASTAHIVDGGAIENFPVEPLLSLSKDQLESPLVDPRRYVVGFTFSPPEDRRINTLGEYIGSLVSAAIDSNVRNSLGKLMEINTIELPDLLDTLQFERAMNEGLRAQYETVYRIVSAEFSAIRRRNLKYDSGTKWNLDYHIGNPNFAKALFDKVSPQILPIKNKKTEVFLHSMNGDGRNDYIKTTWEIEIRNMDENLGFIPFQVFVVKIDIDNLDSEYTPDTHVFDEKGNELKFAAFRGPREKRDDNWLEPVYLFIILDMDRNIEKIIVEHREEMSTALPKLRVERGKVCGHGRLIQEGKSSEIISHFEWHLVYRKGYQDQIVLEPASDVVGDLEDPSERDVEIGYVRSIYKTREEGAIGEGREFGLFVYGKNREAE